MQAVRKVQKVTGTHLTIELPEHFVAQDVEIIVIPYQPEVPSMQEDEGWKEDFFAVSQWNITEEEVKVKSWAIPEL